MRVLVVLVIVLYVTKAEPNTDCKAKDKEVKHYRYQSHIK